MIPPEIPSTKVLLVRGREGLPNSMGSLRSSLGIPREERAFGRSVSAALFLRGQSGVEVQSMEIRAAPCRLIKGQTPRI